MPPELPPDDRSAADGSGHDVLGEDVVGGYRGPNPFADPVPATPRRTTRRGAGGIVAAAMLGMRDVLERPKDDQQVTWQASSDPGDLDTDGIDLEVGGVRATAAPLPPLPPRAAPGRRSSRRRR